MSSAVTLTNGHAEQAQKKISTSNSMSTQDYVDLNKQYVAYTHAPIPIVLTEGRGARVKDLHGEEYIDFLAAFSVVNQGHCHPRIIAAMREQSEKLAICTSAFQNEWYPRLAKKMCDVSTCWFSGPVPVPVPVPKAQDPNTEDLSDMRF